MGHFSGKSSVPIQLAAEVATQIVTGGVEQRVEINGNDAFDDTAITLQRSTGDFRAGASRAQAEGVGGAEYLSLK